LRGTLYTEARTPDLGGISRSSGERQSYTVSRFPIYCPSEGDTMPTHALIIGAIGEGCSHLAEALLKEKYIVTNPRHRSSTFKAELAQDLHADPLGGDMVIMVGDIYQEKSWHRVNNYYV